MKNSILLAILGFLILPGILHSCEELPTLTTLPVTNITGTSATSGGTITGKGSGTITERGICWSKNSAPTIADVRTTEGGGTGSFISNISNLSILTKYYVRAYATNNAGTSYGNEVTFTTTSSTGPGTQIIADHSVVDRFDDIPQVYISEVKKMWLTVPGESHSGAYRTGLELLEAAFPTYDVAVGDGGSPDPYTSSHLRANRATWGDYSNSSGWISDYGEEDWFTGTTAISRTKAGISYCNSHNLLITAIGFGWCNDATTGNPTANADPIYGVHWSGVSVNGPDGSKAWGIDAADYAETGNTVNMDTYLKATQEYIDHCTANSYPTKVFFTTGTVESYNTEEPGYQGYLKYEHIREYVKADPERILFDYADILCYDDDGTPATTTWNGHTYPVITNRNATPAVTGHISNAGALRLGKAMWWMLARMAGWDGN